MAIQSEYGDAGFTLWRQWSIQSQKWNERTGKQTWRSFKAGRGITIGTLYHEAKQNGWRGRTPPLAINKRMVTTTLAEDRDKARRAAIMAQQILLQSKFTTHPYLERKGFPDTLWTTHRRSLVVPARKWPASRGVKSIRSMQFIDKNGEKRFLKNGKISDCAYILRQGPQVQRPMFFCEGLATGLSCLAAAKEICIPHGIVVCFSSGGIQRLARRHKRALVIADNDKSGAGEAAAKKVKKPYWMPHQYGDANDAHRKFGIEYVVKGLRQLLNKDEQLIN